MAEELSGLYDAVGNLALDFHRYRSIEEAVESERDPETWLNSA